MYLFCSFASMYLGRFQEVLDQRVNEYVILPNISKFSSIGVIAFAFLLAMYEYESACFSKASPTEYIVKLVDFC